MKMLLVVVVILLEGCAASNLAEVVKAAGQDEATVCARVTTVYGTLTYMRTNIQGGDVSCDTLGVKSTPNAVSIPMTITPAFTVGPTR